MICPNCGKHIQDGAKFCTKCGSHIDAVSVAEIKLEQGRENNTNNDSGVVAGFEMDSSMSNSYRNQNASDKKTFKWEEKHTYIAIGFAIVLAASVGLVFRIVKTGRDDISSSSSSYEEISFADNNEHDEMLENEEKSVYLNEPERILENADVNTDERNSADYEGTDNTVEEEITPEMDYDLLNEFGIDSSTIEDYSANLEPNRYLLYDSGMGEFYFYYPAYLFNSVSVDDSEYQTEYGSNIKTICFTGSAGTELYYSMYKRTDGVSISGLTEIINQNEHDKYFDMSDILVRSDDEKGRIVLAGVMDEAGRYRIYDLIKIDSDYVYRMLSVKPRYRTEEERIQYAYVTENEYRMCGFSGSSQAARSYNEYLESNP